MLKSKLSLLRSLAIGLVFVLSMSTVAFGMAADSPVNVQDYSQYTGVVKGAAPQPNDTPADVGGTVVEITDESTIPVDKSEIIKIGAQHENKIRLSNSRVVKSADGEIVPNRLPYVFISDSQSKVSWSGQWIYINYAFSALPYKLSDAYWYMNVRKPDGSIIADTVTMEIIPSPPASNISKTFAIYTGNNNNVNIHNWDHNFYFSDYSGDYGFNGDYVLNFTR